MKNSTYLLCIIAAECLAASAQSGTPAAKGVINNVAVNLPLCERVVTRSQFDVAPVGPTTTFAYRGTVTNVFEVLQFTPAIDVGKDPLKVVILKNGSFHEDRGIEFQTGGKTAMFSFTLMPGNYDLELVNSHNPEQGYVKNHFTVAPDTVGARATGNIQSGVGKLMACREVDDDWKCVGESTTWKANQPFNVYVSLPVPAGLTLTKWVIHKQNPDDTDGVFVNEMMQNIGDGKYRKWATTEGLRLPVGVYTIYSIAAAEAQSLERFGNLKKYFAKTTLTLQ